VRIIAGKYRGRRLVAPKGLGTRPTTDRVREAWFSILGPLDGLVIDIYAGTGALGFEALSRGAEHAVFVESGRDAQIAIKRNAHSLGVEDRITLLSSTVEAATKVILGRAPFDLVLTDPPWTHLSSATRALSRLLRAELIHDSGRIILGHPKGSPIQLAQDCGLSAQSSRSWGDSAATFYSRAEPQGSL
jgi:16S rRNA (guanine966-N2)-methyltransferase